ncbi:MAG: SOS response-associated peptidase [bacterium]|nr:SOS response-associated peptidase [bacterium]MDT8367383.1 SOS response-associated peptidase [bacterium]
MCGRFVQFTLFPLLEKEFSLKFGADIPLRPSYNIAPTQDVPVVVNDGGNRLITCRWGLIPPWAKDPSIGNRMINARAETLTEKPSFKGSLKKHRCLIVADGFYEWEKTASGKTPIYITMKDGRPLGFAGLYSDWRPPEGEAIRTCTIVTTEPNELLEPIHNRMPVIIKPDDRDRWLDPAEQDPEKLTPLLIPYPAKELEAWEVSRAVNSPGNDGPANIKPLE